MSLEFRNEFRKNICNDPILGPAFTYWKSKCGTRTAPSRRDIDVMEIPRRLLPYLQITERAEDGKRIRFRLVGTSIVEAYGTELTGKYMDEVYSGDRLRYIEVNYRTVCEKKRPLLVINRYCSTRDVPLVCNRLLMPLCSDGTTIDQFLTAMRFEFPGDSAEWRGEWFGNNSNFDFARSFAVLID